MTTKPKILATWNLSLITISGLIALCCQNSTTVGEETLPSTVISTETYSLQGFGIKLTTGENIHYPGDSTVVDSVQKTDIFFQGVDSSHIRFIAHPTIVYVPAQGNKAGLVWIHEDTTVTGIQLLPDTSIESVREVPTSGYKSSVSVSTTSMNNICAVVTRENLYALFKISDFSFGHYFRISAKIQMNGTRSF